MIGEPAPLVVAHFKCADDKFHPDNNPDGKINFGTAENHLMDEEMLRMVNQPLSYSAKHLHYDLPHGAPTFRTAVAGFMEENLEINDVNPDNIVVAGGASAILESIAMSLFEDGEGLVVPTPYYSGFVHDFCTRFNVRILPYRLSPDNGYELEIAGLKEVVEEARNEGIIVKAILMSSPQNPLGITYGDKKLEQIVEMAREYDLDIIADEMYAQSVYKGQFRSMLEIGWDYREHIHFVYGFAKDLVLSGFKTGILYSENRDLVSAVQEIAYFHPVSTQTQFFLENLISDRSWCREFAAINRAKLLESYTLTEKLLRERLGIKIIEANAGIFVWADFSDLLQEQTFEAEMALFQRIFNECDVNISPGQYFDSKTPGWFRICFAQKEEHMIEAAARLRKMM